MSEPRPREGTFRAFLLNHRGYEFIGAPAPESQAFREDLRNRAVRLNDPPVSSWEPGYQDEGLHALVIIANDDGAALDGDVLSFRREAAAAGVSVLLDEPAAQLFREGQPIEHFGYVDGISQPFIDDEARAQRYRHWSPAASRELILAREPGAPGHFGSYCVFRKLEQDVAHWQRMMEELAQRQGVSPEFAAARAVGRFKDGSPVLLHDQPSGAGTPVNDFTYHGDEQGSRCPMNAHIRKVNPRWSHAPGSGESVPDRRIVRRGMTYGVRPDLHPNARGLPSPSRGVGLLFMCYQASIEEQFEHIQAQWANAAAHPRPGAGVDPIVGRGSAGTESDGGSRPRAGSPGFEDAVRFLGGGYFFAPSLTFLRSL